MTEEGIYCTGQYYNYKKGMEYCKHTENCTIYLKGFAPEMPHYRHDKIKDFRNCKEYTKEAGTPQ